MPSALAASPARAIDGGQLPAQAAPQIELTLSQVVPTVVGPGQAWAVQGRVENASEVSVQLDEVRLLTAYRALDTTADLDNWIAGDTDVATPRVLGSADVSRPLSPGQGRDFYIAMPAGAIEPPFSFASLPLRLETSAADGVPVGELRTVLPWFSGAPVENPLDVSWIVPLTVPPDPDLNTETAPERTQAWLDIVGDESPARAWLDGLSAYNATFVIDPSLLVPLTPASDVSAAPAPEPLPLPEPTQTPDSPTGDSPEPSDGDAPATSELSDPGDPSPAFPLPPADLPDDLTLVQEAEVALQQQLTGLDATQTWWLPVADPDVAAMIDIGIDSEVVDAVVGAPLPPSVLDTDRLVERGRDDITWPMWPGVTQEQLSDLHDLSPTLDIAAVLVPRSTFTDAGGLNAEPDGSTTTGRSEVTLLGYDETLSTLVSEAPAADRDGGPIQLLLAHTLARYQRQPANPGAVIIAPARDSAVDSRTVADLGDALALAPWVAQVSAEPLVEGDSETVSLSEDTQAASPAASPLSTARVARIEDIRSTLGQLAAVVPRGGAVQQWEPILNGLYSARWRNNPDGWAVPLTELESQVATIIEGVSINPTTVNFLAEEGLIQITIVNDLPITVQDLTLNLEPGNGRLRIIEEPGAITIGPQSRATVQFRARAIAAGEVPVRASLSTPSGLQIGDVQEVGVKVRPTGIWIYWVLGGVAGVILVLGLTRALRRPAAAAPTGPSDTVEPS